MRLLFEIDTKQYKKDGTVFYRPSSRGIYIKDKKIMMIFSPKYQYYKIPGGGIEKGESKIEALIREFREESGFAIIPSSIKEYGYIHRVQKGKTEDIFIQDNYYYTVDCDTFPVGQDLDAWEKEEGFTPVFIDPIEAIKENEQYMLDKWYKEMIIRENLLLKRLIEEHYFDN